jgi:hypothetical protein
MPDVIEKKRWGGDAERYVVTATHRIIHLVRGDQERVATSDLLNHVLDMPVAQQTTSHMMRLSNVMKALGWERTSNGKVVIGGEQVRGYFRWIEEPGE